MVLELLRLCFTRYSNWLGGVRGLLQTDHVRQFDSNCSCMACDSHTGTVRETSSYRCLVGDRHNGVSVGIYSRDPSDILRWIMLTLVTTDFKLGMHLTHGRESLEGTAEELEDYYGNLSKSMFWLFKCISDGVEPLAELCSPWYNLIFCFYMSFVLYAVLNVVIANFIEVSLEVADAEEKKQLSSSLLKVLQKVVQTTPGASIYRQTFELALETSEMQENVEAIRYRCSW